MKIKIPPFIKENDTIGVTAPSFGCATEPYITKFKTAKKILEDKGFKIKAGDTVFMCDGKGISTEPSVCAKELVEFYTAESVPAVISAGGGEMMCETAGLVDFQKLRECSPKWYMGYSDNTNFIFPLVTVSRTAAIYGPCIGGFGKKWEQSESDAFDLLCGKISSVKGYEKFQRPEDDADPAGDFFDHTYSLTAPKILSSFIPQGGTLTGAGDETIEFEGMLLGGCLDVLANLCGTKLDCMKEFNAELDDKKIIWVLESCDANPMEIRRQIWHLKNAGWFDRTGGFLIGRPLSSFEKEMMGVNQYNAVTDILEDLGVPVIMDCDIGHIDPAMPLVMGAMSRVRVKSNEISIDFKLS